MMKVLVLVGRYPDPDGTMALRFIHVRNVAYKEHGIDVTVLSFTAKNDYTYENIPVITCETFRKSKDKMRFDVLIAHQPNLKYHYRFLRQFGDMFPRFVFVFHGQEMLRINRVYPKPYNDMRPTKWQSIMRDAYDTVKLRLWRSYLSRVSEKSQYWFVSQWMLNEVLKWTRLPFSVIQDRYAVVHNGIGAPFMRADYDDTSLKEYDFITIRNDLDGSKYCADYVNALAKANPDMRFLVIGKGEYFRRHQKAENLFWQDRILSHQEVLETIGKARCALMPTRQDTQGVMVCELATTGMPVITSDIPVCHEIVGTFANVALISNDDVTVDLKAIRERLEAGMPYAKNRKYFDENTSMVEVKLLERFFSAEP